MPTKQSFVSSSRRRRCRRPREVSAESAGADFISGRPVERATPASGALEAHEIYFDSCMYIFIIIYGPVLRPATPPPPPPHGMVQVGVQGQGRGMPLLPHH